MSRATSAIGRDVSITIFTASSLNSCVNFLRRSGILHPPFRAGLYWIRCPESPRHAIGCWLPRDGVVLLPGGRGGEPGLIRRAGLVAVVRPFFGRRGRVGGLVAGRAGCSGVRGVGE